MSIYLGTNGVSLFALSFFIGQVFQNILLMEEILTRGCIKPCKYWGKLCITSINSRSFGVHIEGFHSMLHLRFLREGNTSASPGFMMKFIQDAAPGSCKHVKFHTTKTLDLHRWKQKMTLENPPFSIRNIYFFLFLVDLKLPCLFLGEYDLYISI